MKPFPALSPSSIADFEGCPKRWHEVKILKKYPFVQTESLTYGNDVHEKLEHYTKFQTPLPEHLEYVAPVIDALREGGYVLVAELELGITKDWDPCGFWDKNCFLRGKVDLVAVNQKQAILIDWKTGKRKPDPFQLQIYGAILYQLLSLERVDAGFAWLKTQESDAYSITAENFPEIVTDIMQRTDKMRQMYEQQDFPARTSPLCCWCPALNDCKEAIYYKENIGRRRK